MHPNNTHKTRMAAEFAWDLMLYSDIYFESTNNFWRHDHSGVEIVFAANRNRIAELARQLCKLSDHYRSIGAILTCIDNGWYGGANKAISEFWQQELGQDCPVPAEVTCRFEELRMTMTRPDWAAWDAWFEMPPRSSVYALQRRLTDLYATATAEMEARSLEWERQHDERERRHRQRLAAT